MIQLMGLPEVVRSEETVDVQGMTHLILREREKRLNLIKEIIFQKQKNHQLEEFVEQLAKSVKFSQEPAKIHEPSKVSQQIGAYSSHIRSIKIKKYKMKLKKRRSHVIISREFKGRSISSKLKPRLKGKFAKKTS
ncbi:hypothetical protein SteCoe_2888 [Stentor coeruleus]|uniref:Uncharacterized protein n=1 Tax=Stentor coeruleus TaxID=5963 RepID=A0A1R2CYB7_9CILI|nr:hypothetical protein SteCoe_2888 [Stentor coeruleus]